MILSFLNRLSLLERLDRWASRRVNTSTPANTISWLIIAGLWLSAIAWVCGIL